MGLYRGKVLRWVDGDTLDAQVDLRHGLTRHVRIRLAGIAAPETRGQQRPFGIVTKHIVEMRFPDGIDIGLEDYGDADEDAFGRWLCRVGTVTTGIDIGEWLIENGFAIPYDLRRMFDWDAVTDWPLPPGERPVG